MNRNQIQVGCKWKNNDQIIEITFLVSYSCNYHIYTIKISPGVICSFKNIIHMQEGHKLLGGWVMLVYIYIYIYIICTLSTNLVLHKSL